MPGLAQASSYEFRIPAPGVSAFIESAPSEASQLVCGHYHCYALVAGTVWSAGWNNHGQLGRNERISQSTWGATNLTGVSRLVSAGNSGYALKDGTVWSIEWNNNGQLGLGDTTNRSVWTQLPENTFQE